MFDTEILLFRCLAKICGMDVWMSGIDVRMSGIDMRCGCVRVWYTCMDVK